MAGNMDKVTEAIDKLVTAVKAEIDRTKKHLEDTVSASGPAGDPALDSAIQTAVDRLNNLSAQLDAVEPDEVVAGTAAAITPLAQGEASPGQLGSSPATE